jgi:uncharacterized protein
MKLKILKPITIKDKVYGSFKITDPILIELLKSKAVLRLKKIRQQGLPKDWLYGFEFSRYEHSVGVLLLLKKLNASLKEQVAGILHDVSHMAFSHLYDYLIENYDESHGDNIFYDFLKKDKEIKSILKKYNLSLKEIYDFSAFSLLEKDAPNLCADRIDYTLRECYYFKNDKKTINLILDNLIVKDNEIIFKNKKAAFSFYKIYKYFSENHWGGEIHIYRYNLFIECLNIGLEKKVISLKDFYKTDDYIIEKIIKIKDPLILNNLNLLNNKNLKIPKNHFMFKGKKRFVNPKYILNKDIKRVV